ncbi:hypothetical protein TFLX_02007 [Thermoflexales bacterium]|nr:hypothetical protein TFLX_02007 [Thermoflexales bacterium]
MAEVAFRDYLNEIDDLIERGSIAQAMQHCRHFLTQYPKAVEVYRMMGKALLEQEDDRAAQDVFQRVLSVDPEDFVARVGLSIIHDRNNELELAIWHMERAFEIAPSNALIQGELRRLYARRDGDSPERIPLTRGALARLYAAGDLASEAIADLRQLLTEQSDRIDLQVQLAEVLWRDEQRLEAAEYTQQITTTLPYCLKANLILGAILRASGANGESDEPLQRAQAVDPENEYAQQLFSGMGPLYRQPVMVDHLELQTMDQMLEAPLPLAETEEVPDWLHGLSELEQPLLEEPGSAHVPRLPSGMHMPDVATEIPDWLQGLTGEAGASAEAEVPDWLASLAGTAATDAVAAAPIEGVPEEIVIRPADEMVPDWITQLGQTGALTPAEEASLQEEQPDWMAQLRESSPTPSAEETIAPQDTETPDWLAQLQTSAPPLETEPVASEESDWLSQLRTSSGELETEEPAPPIDFTQPSDLFVGEVEQPIAFDVAPAEAEPVVPEEMPSADDALAFLTRLAAGKEDQLREQAQQEAETRMAEIMGRKPAEAAPVTEEKQAPIKMTVPAATVAAVAAGLAAKKPTREEESEELETRAQAPTAEPEVPEEMPSADDALAFLTRLAAGKEDQLRAEAEQEAETRMAVIMGRKPREAKAQEPAVEEKTTTDMAAVGALGGVTIAAAQKEEPPTAVPEEMPSADDALAFLAKLAAGKEDQLRAQAEEEAETRMAAIMGRSTPVETAKPIETAPAAGSSELAEVMETAEPVAESELPEWLRTMQPAEEALAETPEGELPEWLRAMRPSEEAPEAGLTALFEEEEMAAPEAALTFGEISLLSEEQLGEREAEATTEDLVAELAALEQAAVPAEALAKPQTAALLPLDWWVQTAGDTEEEPLAELPQPYLSPRARAAEKEKAAAAAVVTTDEKPRARRLPQTGPLRQTGPLGGKPQTAPLATPEQAAVSTEVEALLARIYQNPEDHATRLDLARTYWATGNREGAYTEYLALVTAGEFTKETMADLETIVEIYDQTDWHRMLGDVYMKAGRLPSALEQYRRALSEV